MSIEESDTVKAARDRMDRNKDGKINMKDLEATGIRDTIIEFFNVILWVALALGIFGALWELVTVFGSGSFAGAISKFVTTVVTVGVGFVVLDIRERMIGRK